MRTPVFHWEEIMEDSAKVMAECIAKNIPVNTVPALYERLKAKYAAEGKAIPTQNTYRQVLHKRLNLKHNQRAAKSALYRLAGAYEKMALNMLADNLTASEAPEAGHGCWLFLKLTRTAEESPAKKERTTVKHLHWLSSALRKEFKDEIIFISFDRDTAVLLCRDSDAKDRIIQKIKKMNDEC